VLRGALDRWYPALSPLHPDLVFWLQLEGRFIETSDPDLDERVAALGCVKDPRPAARAEAATVIARDLAADLKRLDRPQRVDSKGTAGLLSATRAVAAHDMHRVTAHAVADRAAETSAGAYSCVHERRCYAGGGSADTSASHVTVKVEPSVSALANAAGVPPDAMLSTRGGGFLAGCGVDGRPGLS
jgi:hypothetical protein